MMPSMARSDRLRKHVNQLADLSAAPGAAPLVAPALDAAVDAYIAQCRREDARDGRVPVLDSVWEFLVRHLCVTLPVVVGRRLRRSRRG
jgi:hypothetical protein